MEPNLGYQEVWNLEELVAIFIDGSNFYRVLKANKGRHDIDFQKFAAKLVGGRRLLRIYYYTVTVDQFKGLERYKEQQKFFYNLHRTPYLELRWCPFGYRHAQVSLG